MPIRPPAHIEPFVTALGEDDAVRFFLAFGGADLYIARDPKGRGRVEQELGLDVAQRLARLCDQHHLHRRIPIPKPWLAAVLKSRGLSHAEIARRLHASDESVRRWLQAGAETAPTDSRQMRLF